MVTEMKGLVITGELSFFSSVLGREVIIDVYFPASVDKLSDISLLLINDGQNLREMPVGESYKGNGFSYLLEQLYSTGSINPLFCAGIHAGKDRKNEYGTLGILDYEGRGTKVGAYSEFIFTELLPLLRRTYQLYSFKEKSFCGFSLGALSALDIVWENPAEFSKVGLFSPSLWWRSVDQEDELFNENIHRIMHMKIREGDYYPWLKFFFETGTLDETADRNNNGIIDSIDDTLSMIDELVLKGYDRKNDIHYIELKDGKHDVATWAMALPAFLKWGWGV